MTLKMMPERSVIMKKPGFTAYLIIVFSTLLCCCLPLAAQNSSWDVIYQRWVPYTLFGSAHDRYYENQDGEDLGWTEGPYMQGFAYGYRASGDTQWLDSLKHHFDVMITRLTPNPEPEDNYRGWYHVSPFYSTDGQTQFDFIVTEGLIFRGVAMFIEDVYQDPNLQPQYLNDANRYLAIIDEMLAKWDARNCWRTVGSDAGIYLFQNNPNHLRQEMSLPHNMYGEMARMLMSLYGATNNAAYLDRATRLVQNFRNNLIPEGDHYNWHYWDPAGPWDYFSNGDLKHPIFDEHGSYREQDIALAVKAYRYGIVLDNNDITRVINTTRSIWNDATFFDLGWVDETERIETETMLLNEQPGWGWLNNAPHFLWLSLENTGLYVQTLELPYGTQGEAYTYTLQASNGEGPYSWQLTSGNLPGGLNLASSGQISGSPTTAGIYTFTVEVTDNQNATASRDLSIQIFPDDPVANFVMASWAFDETAGNNLVDSTGNFNGLLMNGPQWRPGEGIFNGALAFDGSNDYVDLGGMNFGGPNGVSVAFWFKADDFEVADARFISKATGVMNDEHYLMISTYDGTALRVRLKTGGGTTELISSPGTIQPGQWYHVAMTYDGSGIQLFKNGVEIISAPASGAVDQNNAVATAIGNQPSGAGNEPFDGLLDQMMVFSRGLTRLEVERLYQDGITTGLPGEGDLIPSGFQLQQNYPNPFNPGTTIEFTLPETSLTDLAVFDALGRRVDTIVRGQLRAGTHRMAWQAGQEPSGIYYLRLKAGGNTAVRKMILLR